MVGQVTNLVGYTSTSQSPETAMQFALMNDSDPFQPQSKSPIIFKIKFTGQKGLFKLTEGFTAYQGEGEVLVQDGLRYLITKNKTKIHEKTGREYT